MNIILIINESPWGSTLSATALRLARGFVDAGHKLEAVFFREEGVYNCLQGTAVDSDIEGLAGAWAEISECHNVSMMVCQSSAARRLPQKPDAPFREAGLVELLDRVVDCDRVITL